MPAQYAQAKLATLRARWAGPVGDAVRAYGPRIFPGMPATALLGLTASSEGVTEVAGNTSTMGSAVGVFGVEGPRLGPLARSAECRALLGREARTELTAAGYLGDVAGQVVTGLLNYAAHGNEAMRAGVPSNVLGPDAAGTSFVLRCCASAYSAGNGITAAVLRAYASQLAAVPPARRWSVLANVLNSAGATVGGYRTDGCYGAAFLCVRAEQRLECGRALDWSVGGGNDAWFAQWDASVDAETLVMRAYGQLQSTGVCQNARGATPVASDGDAGGGAAGDDGAVWIVLAAGAAKLAGWW